MAKVTFNNKENIFFQSVKNSVNNYFAEKGMKKTGNWRLYHKAIILIPLSVFLYIYLLTAQYSVLTGVLLSIVFGLALVSIAFNIMHDACHGSFSRKKWVNDIMGHTMNALGSSAFVWKIKHNVVHHTYTNIDGVDDDIAKSPLLRHCPSQKWVPAHRFQFVYMFLLYMLSTILWVFITDQIKYFQKKIIVTDMKMPVKEHIIYWGTKVLYLLFYCIIPIIAVGWEVWLVGYLIMNMTMGLTLSLVFQLAHVVEKTEFVDALTEVKIESEWAIHEIKTTANFAMNNPIVTWFVGGLNYQVEHHLFPKVSHIHYPAISKIVKDQCEKFGIPYHAYDTMSAAVLSHVKFMKQLGSNKI
ncbi:MAG: fatty acid desaturase family protein [Bacteroidia bacterium]